MQSKKIIVVAVDDEETILILQKITLEKAGFDVCTFEGPEDAIKYIGSSRVDIILSDIDMPYISGVEFFLELKKQDLLPKIFAFMTGRWKDEYNYLFEMGLDQVFHKPTPFKEIVQYLKDRLKEFDSQDL